MITDFIPEQMTHQMEISIWEQLYKKGWKNLITDESFSHPAKFARGLIECIYNHCIAEGWLKAGDSVIDPFGGVGLGGLEAMRLGAHWIGVELEPKFVDMAAQNIALWNARYAGRFARWGSARVLQGDSRRLLEVLAESGMRLSVSSPPYADSMDSATNGIDWEKVKRDYPGRIMHAERIALSQKHHNDRKYGSKSDQLGSMPAGEPPTLSISSPPFLQTSGGTSITSESGPLSDPPLIERHAAGNAAAHGYGESAGNIANLPEGDAPELVVSSPPYENLELSGGAGIANEMRSIYREGQNYGESEEQIGAMQSDTFWSAALEIVQQTYAVLAPGGHAVWICKRYVRQGKVVEFSQQWAALCESVGFRVMHWHRAMLTEDHGTQAAMDGNHKRKTKARKSFFRRLAESKGSPAIDWEDVICMVKA